MIRLKENEVLLLGTILEKSKLDKSLIEQLLEEKGYTQDLLLAKRVMNILLDEFTANGLKEDNEPNSYGLKVEDLVAFYSRIQSEQK